MHIKCILNISNFVSWLIFKTEYPENGGPPTLWLPSGAADEDDIFVSLKNPCYHSGGEYSKQKYLEINEAPYICQS